MVENNLNINTRMKPEDQAREYWTSRVEYPNFGPKKRRLHEMNYLVQQLDGVKSLVDVGCGSGIQLGLLRQFTDIEKYLGLDISLNLLEQVDTKIPTKYYDFYKGLGFEMEKFDIALFSGSIQYIMDNDVLQRAFEEINADTIIVRTSCTNEPEDLLINKYSKELGAEYSSLYRTLRNTITEIEKQFKVEHIKKVYPKELDSKTGSTQWWIKAKRK